jgi:hypothetical protein
MGAVPPATPPRRGGPLKIILAIVGGVLALCCIGGVILAVVNWDSISGGDPGSSKAGDCLGGKAIDQSSDEFQEADLKVVKCSDGDAKYKVVGRVEDKTQTEAQTDENVCSAFADATSLYWQGQKGKKGVVLCLKENV